MPRKPKKAEVRSEVSESLVSAVEMADGEIHETTGTPGNKSVGVETDASIGMSFSEIKAEFHKRVFGPQRIHTYFEPTELDYAGELRLLLLWQQKWAALGYEPVVLNESHARSNPRFETFSKRVAEIFSQNPKGYETACWYRHCAMEAVGGGAMSDHDVFPSRYETIPVRDQLTIFENGVPSLISGTAAAFGAFCDHIQNLKDPENPGHRSDMTEIRSLPGLITESRCVQFGDTDWKAANWTHLSHASTHPAGKSPRYKFVREIMEMKG